MLNTSSLHKGANQARSKMKKGLFYLGIVLIIITLVLGGVQDLHAYNIYGSGANKWYFYSIIGVVLLIGIALVVWSYVKRQKPQK
jgi:NADH:ubiquinone oxidoreductase subunit 6 (subunit J)